MFIIKKKNHRYTKQTEQIFRGRKRQLCPTSFNLMLCCFSYTEFPTRHYTHARGY